VDKITFLRLNHALERFLTDLLHPLALREELMANTLDVWVLDDYRVQYVASISLHRGECDTVFVDVHTNHRLSVFGRINSACLVGDGDVESPLVVFVHDFCHANTPCVRVERVLHSFKMVGTTP